MTPVDRVRLIVIVFVAVVSLPAGRARAQSAEAEALFRDGRSLVKDGKLAAGCDKLAASDQLEPSIGTLLNLGDCREKLGKLASAWAAFRKAEAMARRAGGDERRQVEAGRRAAALEPRLTNLVVGVAARPDGLVVRRNDEVLDPAMWNTPVPVDPGTYTMTAEAPGYVPWRLTVEVASGTRRRAVEVPALERAPVVPATAPVALPGPAPRTELVTVHRDRTWSAARGVALGIGIAGLGALGTGLYFGLHARDLEQRADQLCPLALCPDPEGLHDNTQAQTSANRANILYGAGAAAVVTSVVLWLVGVPGDETSVRPTFGDRQAGVAFAGTF